MVFPVIWFGTLLSVWIANDVVATDFHHYYWPAGDRLLHGETPYVHGPWFPAELPFGFVYPAPAAVLFAPSRRFPARSATSSRRASVAAPFAVLRLLDVRDFRCYGIVFLWAPVTFGVQTREPLDAADRGGRGDVAVPRQRVTVGVLLGWWPPSSCSCSRSGCCSC